jgi:hypothetical protein
MSVTPASAKELGLWNKWLWKSHGLKSLPGASVFVVDCNVGYPLLLTPWKKFEEFTMRLDREVSQPIISFRLHGQIRTIAGFWFNPSSIRMSFSRGRSIELLTSRMMAAAEEGTIWWGVEFPPESTSTTSIIYSFPKSFPFPPEIKTTLQTDPPIQPLETSLQLV